MLSTADPLRPSRGAACLLCGGGCGRGWRVASRYRAQLGGAGDPVGGDPAFGLDPFGSPAVLRATELYRVGLHDDGYQTMASTATHRRRMAR